MTRAVNFSSSEYKVSSIPGLEWHIREWSFLVQCGKYMTIPMMISLFSDNDDDDDDNDTMMIIMTIMIRMIVKKIAITSILNNLARTAAQFQKEVRQYQLSKSTYIINSNNSIYIIFLDSEHTDM